MSTIEGVRVPILPCTVLPCASKCQSGTVNAHTSCIRWSGTQVAEKFTPPGCRLALWVDSLGWDRYGCRRDWTSDWVRYSKRD